MTQIRLSEPSCDIFKSLIVIYLKMPKLTNILLAILVICTLGSSSAWAYGEHAVSFDIAQHNHHSDDQPTVDESLKDHCGHLSAHIVGLLRELCFSFSHDQLNVQPEVSEHFVSFVPLLYLRPPSI